MANIERRNTWVSIHSHYLEFAYQSYRACFDGPAAVVPSGLSRSAIEAARYAYDCIEASTEFVYHMGRLQQLPQPFEANWLARHAERRWNSLNLSDRIGLLSYAWRNEQFWRTAEQYQLFEALKRVRDGLTHPVPFGTFIEYDGLEREQLADGTIYTRAQPITDPKQIGSGRMRFDESIEIGFAKNTFDLGPDDAERACEILLLHLVRFEEIFFGRATTWFSIYDSGSRDIRSARALLRSFPRRYGNLWSAPA